MNVLFDSKAEVVFPKGVQGCFRYKRGMSEWSVYLDRLCRSNVICVDHASTIIKTCYKAPGFRLISVSTVTLSDRSTCSAHRTKSPWTKGTDLDQVKPARPSHKYRAFAPHIRKMVRSRITAPAVEATAPYRAAQPLPRDGRHFIGSRAHLVQGLARN